MSRDGNVISLAERRRRREPVEPADPSVVPCVVIGEYIRFDGARCVYASIRRADGVLQSGFEAPVLRDMENALTLHPPRKCRWLPNGSVLQQVGPFDGLIAKLESCPPSPWPIPYQVDEYQGGW